MASLMFYISLILCFWEMILLYKILNNKDTMTLKFGDYVFILFNAFLALILHNNNLMLLKAFLTIGCLITLNYCIFKDSIKTTIINSCIIWFLGLILDLIMTLIASIILQKLLTRYLLYIQALLTFVIVICLYKIANIKKFKNVFNKYIHMINYLKKVRLANVLYIITFLSLILIDLWCYLNINNNTIQLFIASNFIFLLIAFICVVVLIYKNYIYNDVYKYLNNNCNYFQKKYEELSIFKHNIKNELLTIKSVGNKKIAELIDATIFDSIDENNKYIKNLPAGIDGLIMEKIQPYLNKGISIKLDNKIKSNVFQLLTPLNYRNFCKYVCIVLDNALESSSLSNDKSVCITFKENQNFLYAEIVNTFGNTIDIDKFGNLHYSSKGNGRGLGIFSMLAKKKIQIKFKVIDNIFYNQIIVNKK